MGEGKETSLPGEVSAAGAASGQDQQDRSSGGVVLHLSVVLCLVQDHASEVGHL